RESRAFLLLKPFPFSECYNACAIKMTSNAPASMLLRNARVVLPDQTIESANVLFSGDRIAAVEDSSSEPLPPASSAFDLAGMTLMPGFIDVHIHGAIGVDTMNASAD